MICKYCKRNHKERANHDFDGKPFICIELHEAMLQMNQKQLREEVDHEFLRTWSAQCPHCNSYHHAWPPCSEELGTTRAAASSPAPVTSSPAPVTSSPAPVTSSPAVQPGKPQSLHASVRSTSLPVLTGNTYTEVPAFVAEVRTDKAMLLATCTASSEAVAVSGAVKLAAMAWRASR